VVENLPGGKKLVEVGREEWGGVVGRWHEIVTGTDTAITMHGSD